MRRWVNAYCSMEEGSKSWMVHGLTILATVKGLMKRVESLRDGVFCGMFLVTSITPPTQYLGTLVQWRSACFLYEVADHSRIHLAHNHINLQ